MATIINVVTWNDAPAPANGFVALAKIPHFNISDEEAPGLRMCSTGDLNMVTIKAVEDVDHPRVDGLQIYISDKMQPSRRIYFNSLDGDYSFKIIFSKSSDGEILMLECSEDGACRRSTFSDSPRH